MPAKNSVKKYFPGGFYHIFNRGVNKRKIFQDKQDYAVFLSYLKEYLLEKDLTDLRNILNNEKLTWKQKRIIQNQIFLNNFFGEIELLSYALLPNHFHLLIKQNSATSIDSFMQSLITRYVMYFNKKYKRVGGLFQSKYKAVLVSSEEQLLHLSRYIHLNPVKQCIGSDPIHCYSSYANYVGRKNTAWVNKKTILAFFSQTNPLLSYESFVLESKNKTELTEIIASYVLD